MCCALCQILAPNRSILKKGCPTKCPAKYFRAMFRLLVRLTSLIALDASSQPGSNCDWTWFNGHWQAEDKAKSETDYGSLSILIPFPRHLMIVLEQYDTKTKF